ncbi:hypothetical protein BURK1_00830 [Burkholderiales bacterium]|nr:hypothetical protein BURK1_00830 [Burkholderiales bacterium]
MPDEGTTIASVPTARALVWYGDAMRLWKRGPATLSLLAVLTVLAQVALETIPDAGALASRIIVPLIACGMLYGAAAAEAGARPRVAHALYAFRAPAAAIGAIVLSSTITFAAEWMAADRFAGVNLLRPAAAPADLDAATVLAIYAIGILVSLPMSLVPLAALFGDAGFGRSFSISAVAFLRNPGAFVVYGAIAFALLALGLLTMGIGLVIALPLIACATYVAWRDLCGR